VLEAWRATRYIGACEALLRGHSWRREQLEAFQRRRLGALLRHAYVLPEYQRQGIGTALRTHVETQVRGVRRVIVGTYAGNYKARRLLEGAGYALSPDPEVILRTYYSIPEDRLQSSVTYEKTL